MRRLIIIQMQFRYPSRYFEINFGGSKSWCFRIIKQALKDDNTYENETNYWK